MPDGLVVKPDAREQVHHGPRHRRSVCSSLRRRRIHVRWRRGLVECWCDNAIGSQATPSSFLCTSKCLGNSREICGGANALNVYELTGANTPVPACPVTWSLEGCFSDIVVERVLGFEMMSSGATVESCTAACAAENYLFAGLEFFRPVLLRRDAARSRTSGRLELRHAVHSQSERDVRRRAVLEHVHRRVRAWPRTAKHVLVFVCRMLCVRVSTVSYLRFNASLTSR